jgi:hypothetical protein
MKPIIIHLILLIVLSIVLSFTWYYYLESIIDSPWVGMICSEMIDWSGTDAHKEMTSDGHLKFHTYYGEHCNAPIEMMNMTGGN